MHELDMIALSSHIKRAIKEAFKELDYEKGCSSPIKPSKTPAQVYEEQMLAQKSLEEEIVKSKRKKKP